MATGGEDAKVNIWAVGKTSPLLASSLGGHSCAVESVALDWPEEIVVAGANNGCIKLWDLEHSKVIRTLIGHKAATHLVEFHPFGDFFASGSKDDTIKIWDIRRKGCIQTYRNKDVNTMRITPDGRWIATGSHEGVVRIWDMTAGRLLHTLEQHSHPLFGILFSPLEFTLYTFSQQGQLTCVDLETCKTLATSSLNTTTTTLDGSCATFHPEGQLFYIAHPDGLQGWSKDVECLHSLSIPWSNVADMKVLVDEDKMIAGSIDQNIVCLWGTSISMFKKANAGIDQLSVSQMVQPSESTPLNSVSPIKTPARSSSHIPPIRASSTSSEPAAKVTHRSPLVENQSFFPASTGEKAMGLDMSKFAQPGKSLRKNPSLGSLPSDPLSSDQDVIDVMFARHTSIVSILKNRLNNLRIVKQAWDEGFNLDYTSHSIKPSLECMRQIGDSAIWIDILRMLNIRPKLMATLDICEHLLPILGELVFESYEDYIVTACTTIKLLSKTFSQLILSTVQSTSAYQSPGVDITREERLQRCQSCLKGFQTLTVTLTELKSSPGHVGITVRDTLKELIVFTE